MTGVTRRGLCVGGLAGGMTMMAGHSSAAEQQYTPAIETAQGKVRGTKVRGISKFLGIPYGADTGGANRFMPPRPAANWTGVRDCFDYGASSPQAVMPFGGGSPTQANPEAGKVMATLFGAPGEKIFASSEDCLFLNVWTPDASPRRKRPVMFWLHGGGFGQGNGSSSNYEGTNLCLRGDVVVVTINHRLTAMGYLYLGGISSDFADSGNIGQLDQIAALRWVRDNIAAFGGDPHNVTIFGESGGGGKVSTLLAMPPAKGLFHKAIIQSGPGLRATSTASANALAERTLAALGIAKGDVRKLQTLDYKQVVGAALSSQPRGQMELQGMPLSPVVDGRSLPRDPFYPDGPAVSASVPIIVGSNKDESTLFSMFDPSFGKMTVDDVKARFRAMFGAKGDAAFDLASKRRPNDAPTYWYTTMATAQGMWNGSIVLAERKFAQGAAPVYMYRLDWETPVMNGALRAPHGLDTSLVFDNAAVGGGIVGPGPNPHKIAADMSQAWINFARTGNPSTKANPWPKYDPTTRKTMIFDLPSHVVSDPDPDIRKFFA